MMRGRMTCAGVNDTPCTNFQGEHVVDAALGRKVSGKLETNHAFLYPNYRSIKDAKGTLQSTSIVLWNNLPNLLKMI